MLVVLMCFKHEAKAQKIHFCDTTNKWVCFDHSYAELTNYRFLCEYSSDTIMVNNYVYQRAGGAYGTMYIREDTLAGKVYCITDSSWFPYDSSEMVLYDYNLHVGDTVKRPLQNNTIIHVVSSVDSVMIEGLWYKVWHLESIALGVEYDVIEGIGSDHNPFFPVWPTEFENTDKLLCFSNKGISPIVSPPVAGYFDNVNSCLLAVPNIKNRVDAASVVPNPITPESKLVFPSEIDAGTITIYNDVGQCVANKSIAHQEYESLGDKVNTAGIYFYRLTDERNKRSFTGKFTKN